MNGVLFFSDQYRLILAIVKGIILIGSTIGLTHWYLNFNKRTITARQRRVLVGFSLTIAGMLCLLYLSTMYPPFNYVYLYPMNLALSIMLANFFLLCVIAPHFDEVIYQNTRNLTLGLSSMITIFTATNPFHKTVDFIAFNEMGQLHWLINVFFYYGVACLLIGFFIYFSYLKRARDWSIGLVAMGITASMILFIGIILPYLYEWDLFPFLLTVVFYYVIIYDLVFRAQRGPFYLKHLPIFERAEIMMSILGPDLTIQYASHGFDTQSEIIDHLTKEVIERADGNLHLLDLDEAIYQWSAHMVDKNYLITIENITDLMMDLRDKEAQREEIERHELVLSTQSTIDHEIEHIQFRLQLLAEVENETKPYVAKLKEIINHQAGPVMPSHLQTIIILARFIKRRSLILLENSSSFGVDWIKLLAQELLEIRYPDSYALNMNPELSLGLEQMKQLQKALLDVALLPLSGVELLLSFRDQPKNKRLNILMRSTAKTEWRESIKSSLGEYIVSEDADSVLVAIGLGE